MVLQPVINGVSVRPDAAPRSKAVTVASRYSQQKPAAAGMPTLKSQLETAKAELARSQATEEAAKRQASESAATVRLLRSLLRAELGTADEQLGAAETAAQEWCSEACRLGAGLEALAVREAELRAECVRNAHMSSSLEAARESIAELQAKTLPRMAREVEEERARADRAEAQAELLRARVASRDATLGEQSGHFGRLSTALGTAEGSGGLSALAQSALGSFGLLYAERGLHEDPRFSSLQDVLVKLCMAADALTEWLPWFAAHRANEARQLSELAQVEAEAEAEQAASAGFGDALSPGAWSARRPAAVSRLQGLGGTPISLRGKSHWMGSGPA